MTAPATDTPRLPGHNLGKRYARRLSAAEVLDVLALRGRMTPAQIALKHHTAVTTVGRILRGETYRNASHLPGLGPECACPSCTTVRLAAQNAREVQMMRVSVHCATCAGPAESTASTVLSRNGNVSCDKCEGST